MSRFALEHGTPQRGPGSTRRPDALGALDVPSITPTKNQQQKTGIDNTYTPARIYVNGQTAGQCGYPHSDDGHLTFLYFPNLEWNIDWQGHLLFINRTSPTFGSKGWDDWKFIPDQTDEISQTISYKPNRAVFFPAHIVHYADAPHRLFNWLRMSLAYKFDKL